MDIVTRKKGDRVLIEHVSPLRHLTQMAIEKISKGATDKQSAAFVKARYGLVLLTPEETARLNKQNRSKISHKRLEEAGIQLHLRKRTTL